MSQQIFLAHDETQGARVQEFFLNIKEGNIPPRIAPHFSFGMGYPVFNYYAQFPYHVTSVFQLLGADVVSAMKLSYLVAMTVGVIGMFLFLRRYFAEYASLLGSIVYGTSPFVAVDIFVRGNMGELWVFALLPLSLYLLLTNSWKKLLLTSLVLSFLFTSHNILSLVSISIVSVFAYLTKEKKLNYLSIMGGFLLGSYFLIPAILELSMVHAANAARITDYTDHFLCLSQIWTSGWGFAGSAKGCTADGMSFMLGKVSVLLGVIGISLFIFQAINKKYNLLKFDIIVPKTNKSHMMFFMIITIGSLFLALPASQFIWSLFEPILALFQFPWRFLIFVLFGISIFAAYAALYLPKKFQPVVICVVIVGILFMHAKFFYGQMISTGGYKKTYLSQSYIKNEVAFKVAEYVPKTVDFPTWKSLEKKNVSTNGPVLQQKGQEVLIVEDQPFTKLFMAKSLTPVVANIHYAPYWNITIDYKPFIPTRFDKLGRPFIPVSSESYTSVQIVYRQTTLELMATMLSLLTFIALFVVLCKQFTFSWKTLIKKI